jgi:hypothetical protein
LEGDEYLQRFSCSPGAFDLKVLINPKNLIENRHEVLWTVFARKQAPSVPFRPIWTPTAPRQPPQRFSCLPGSVRQTIARSAATH